MNITGRRHYRRPLPVITWLSITPGTPPSARGLNGAYVNGDNALVINEGDQNPYPVAPPVRKLTATVPEDCQHPAISPWMAQAPAAVGI
ncbi:hypothetical protein KCP73_14590 [Salmonella enterica subsp. enterica]|nr:hypothetical protein KCP73_14590 [Salmonella enterica subsp. enterica]